MILQGNQRGGAKDLALHLLKEENDHVEVHELRGFVSDDLLPAFREVEAISRGTKAKQYLYSLSLNPPLGADVSTSDFKDAINRAEATLGLSGQPRAIVFHEKRQGTHGQNEDTRRHCHVVWSRIDAQEMKAIPLPYTKYKLRDLSRELYIEHGWQMPRGFMDQDARDPRNFTLAQWQQAKRSGKDPRIIKTALQDSWAISDTQNAFEQALKERGFMLARGDRRSFVVLDHHCEVYAVPKWLGLKTKVVRERLSDQDALPSVDEAKAHIAQDMSKHLSMLSAQKEQAIQRWQKQLAQRRAALNKKQSDMRAILKAKQEQRQAQEIKERQARFNKGWRGFLDRLTGKHKKIKTLNEQETIKAELRNQKERDGMIVKQAGQRRALEERSKLLDTLRHERQKTLSRDIEQYNDIRNNKRKSFEIDRKPKSHEHSREPKLEL